MLHNFQHLLLNLECILNSHSCELDVFPNKCRMTMIHVIHMVTQKPALERCPNGIGIKVVLVIHVYVDK